MKCGREEVTKAKPDDIQHWPYSFYVLVTVLSVSRILIQNNTTTRIRQWMQRIYVWARISPNYNA